MKLKITQIRSTIGRKYDQKRTIIALGLGKISRSRMHDDNLVIRGMINKVSHLLKVEEIKEEPVKKAVPVKPVTKKAMTKTKKPKVEKKAETKPTAKKAVKTKEVKKAEPQKSTAKKKPRKQLLVNPK
jgi:large subunit ribosomal protein L30